MAVSKAKRFGLTKAGVQDFNVTHCTHIYVGKYHHSILQLIPLDRLQAMSTHEDYIR